MRKILLALILLAVAAPAQATDYKAIAAGAARGHILPAYERLSRATAAFAAETGKGCADVAGLRRSYAAAVLAWQGAQHLRFGPADWFDRAARFALWPDTRNVVGRQLAEILAKRELPDFKTASIAVQGLTALERVLWDDNGRKLADAFACRWTGAVAAHLAAMARDIESDWREDRFFATRPPVESARDVFKALHLAVELVADHKLARPLGPNAANARPRLAEHWRSHLSGPAVATNLDAAVDIFASIAPFVTDTRLAEDIARRLDAARDRAKPLDLDAGWANLAIRPGIETLRKDLLALKEILGTRLAADLDLPLGFNGLDGD